MELRTYQTKDCVILAELFFNTVHTVNAKDYSKEQLNAWATGDVDLEKWNNSFLEHITLIAEMDKIIVGFGDMDNRGYLDKLYVHKDYQSRGIASEIVNRLEELSFLHGISTFSTHASITAKPFFLKRGYTIIGENKIVRNNIELTNYIMEKHITQIEVVNKLSQ